MRRLKYLFLGLNGFIALCTLLAYASPVVDPRDFFVPAVAALLFPYLVLLNLICIAGWTLVRSYYAFISIAVLVLGWQFLGGLFQFGSGSSTEPSPDDGTMIRVATYNAHQFLGLDEQVDDVKSILRQVPAELGNPDIICFQESGWARKYPEALGYPFSDSFKGGWPMLVSKFPVSASGAIDSSRASRLSRWYDIDVRGTTVRVYLLHLNSNRVTRQTESLLEDVRLPDRQTWMEGTRILRRYLIASRTRAEQAVNIRKHIAQCKHPVLVLGDFNDVPLSFAYNQISKEMTDSFVAKGSGLGTTYGGRIPALRIDFVLADGHFEILTHKNPKLSHSDHYPVVVDVRIADL